MHRKPSRRFSARLALGLLPALGAAVSCLACLLPAGCTTGPHPPAAAVTPPPRKDPKDFKDSTPSRRHPGKGKTTGPHPGSGY